MTAEINIKSDDGPNLQYFELEFSNSTISDKMIPKTRKLPNTHAFNLLLTRFPLSLLVSRSIEVIALHVIVRYTFLSR